jgi:hypothetical protein
MEFSTEIDAQPFLYPLVSSRACPLSLEYQAASSQARLRACWALTPWKLGSCSLSPVGKHWKTPLFTQREKRLSEKGIMGHLGCVSAASLIW